MYVFDTSLEPASRIDPDRPTQRLVFRLPRPVLRRVRHDRRRLLAHLSDHDGPPPAWSGDGLVTFTYTTSSERSRPVFCDRRDHPLPPRSLRQVRPGQPVRLTLRQVRRGGHSANTRLEVLKLQLLHMDAPLPGGPASPHSIQSYALQLPVDLAQEVERLAQAEDWSTTAWLRNAIEQQVTLQKARLPHRETVA
jgi:hypothetical protein